MTPEHATTVLGSLRAYRIWAWGKHTQMLMASSFGGRCYTGDKKVYTATCSLGPHLHIDESAPVESCTCGFYAVYQNLGPSVKHTVCVALNIDDPSYVDQLNRTYIYGSVQLSGRLIFGERGVVRAEKLEIEALLVPADIQLRHALARRYPVSQWSLVADLDIFQEMFPLDAPPFRPAAPWDSPIALGTPGGNS